MGSSTTPVSQTTTTQIPREAKDLLGLAMPGLKEWAANPPTVLPWSNVAGFDPAQTAGQNMVLDAAGTQQGVVGGAAASNQRSTSGELLDPNSNPALRATIDASTRPIIDNLMEKALPTIRNGAVSTGNFGSSRQGIAEGLAVRDAAQAVGDTAAKVATTGYGQGLDAMMKGQALAPGVAQSQTLPGVSTSGVGDIRQQLAQALLGEKSGNFNFEQMLPLLMGKELAGIAGSIPGGSTTTTGTTAAPNPIMQGAGLGIAGLGALGSAGGSAGIAGLLPLLAMSDRRQKENIKPIGKLYDGQNVYSFRYKGEQKVQIGLIAQEAPHEAVHDVDGFLMVDYGKATERAAKLGACYGT